MFPSEGIGQVHFTSLTFLFAVTGRRPTLNGILTGILTLWSSDNLFDKLNTSVCIYKLVYNARQFSLNFWQLGIPQLHFTLKMII